MFIAICLTIACAVYVMAKWHATSPLIPVAVSLIVLAGRSRDTALWLRLLAFVVIGAYAWIGLSSVGWFFLPGALAMLVAVTRT
jgi:hypothetical protein